MSPPRRSIPTLENLTVAMELYNEATEWQGARNALLQAFRRLPDHNNPNHVIAKVALINDLYSAQVPRPHRVVISHLLSAKVLGAHRPSADWVHVMAQAPVVVKGRPQYLRSFASKYAHFHYPEHVPVYDRIAEGALKALGYRPTSERDYGRFATMMETFRRDVRGALQDVGNSESVADEPTTWERLDAYLWLLGHYYIFRRREQQGKSLDGLNREVQRIYRLSPSRFASLEPPAPL